MKIGIMTFHYSHNYGALLQTFGLYKKLTELFPDDEVCVVDYCPDTKKNKYSVWRGHSNVKRIMNSIINLPFLMWKKNLHNKFRAKHFKFVSIKEAHSLDYVVCGSDQIWNPRNNKKVDPNYFGIIDGFKGKALTYAASDGGYLGDIDSEILRKYITNLSAVSVREATMLPLVKQYKQDISVVLDPTFLLEKSFWQSFASKKKSDNYIMIYSFGNDKKLRTDAYELAKKKNAEIIDVSLFDFSIIKKIKEKKKVEFGANANDFLSYILNAKYVFTNSFHGTAFSMIFEKDFYVYDKDDKKTPGFLRIKNLLSEFGLENRDGSCFDLENIEKADYAVYRNLITQRRKESISFLTDSFGKLQKGK